MTIITKQHHAQPFQRLTDFFSNPLCDETAFQFLPVRKNLHTVPALNIEEEKDKYFIHLALPGGKKENITISLKDDCLHISYKDEQVKDEKEDKYVHKEFSYTSFTRSVRVPRALAAEKVKAKYEEGMLTLEISKEEEHAQESMIAIN